MSELCDRAGLAFCAQRYDDLITLYQIYLEEHRDIPPKDRSMLYDAYQKRILDDYFKSYWKLTLTGRTDRVTLDYLETIEKRIDRLCQDIIQMIDNYFLASQSNTDLDIVFTLRQRGDFLFFNASIARPATRRIMLQAALRSYTEGRYSSGRDHPDRVLVSLGVERSRLTLPVDETERILIQLRKLACDIQLNQELSYEHVYTELTETIDEFKSKISSDNHPLLLQMETYRAELNKYRR